MVYFRLMAKENCTSPEQYDCPFNQTGHCILADQLRGHAQDGDLTEFGWEKFVERTKAKKGICKAPSQIDNAAKIKPKLREEP